MEDNQNNQTAGQSPPTPNDSPTNQDALPIQSAQRVLTPDATVPITTTQQIIPEPPQKKKLSPLLGVFAALVAAVGLLIGVWFIVSTDTSNSSGSNQQQTIVKNEIPSLRVLSEEPAFGKGFYPPILPTESGVINVARQVFEPLVSFEDSTQIVPLLATSWTNPDLNTWVFKLKPGVVFNNGTPLTAMAAKSSIQATIAANPDTVYIDSIKTVEATDENTLTITTKSPDSTLLNKLTFIPIFDSTASVMNDKTGTGPYTVKSGAADDSTSIILSAVTTYHGGTVYTKELIIDSLYDEEKLADTIKATNYDIINLTNDSVKDTVTSAYPNYTVLVQNTPGATGLHLNTNKSVPLQKLAVRKALYKALDIGKIVEAGGARAKVATQFVTEVVPGYNPSITIPPQDIVAAKKELAEAGYPNGFTLKLLAAGPARALAEEIKTQLAAVGVTLEVNIAEDAATFFSSVHSGANESWISAYSSDINDASDVISAVFMGSTFKNYYSNDSLVAVMDEVGKEFNPAQRLAKLQEASKIIMDDVVFIPIRNRIYQFAVNPELVIKQETPVSGFFGANYWTVYKK